MTTVMFLASSNNATTSLRFKGGIVCVLFCFTLLRQTLESAGWPNRMCDFLSFHLQESPCYPVQYVVHTRKSLCETILRCLAPEGVGRIAQGIVLSRILVVAKQKSIQ